MSDAAQGIHLRKGFNMYETNMLAEKHQHG